MGRIFLYYPYSSVIWAVAKAAVLFSWVLLKFCPGAATVLDGLGTIGTGASAGDFFAGIKCLVECFFAGFSPKNF